MNESQKAGAQKTGAGAAGAGKQTAGKQAAGKQGTGKEKVVLHEIKVKGNQLVDKVRDIIEEGNARRIIVQKDGRPVMEFPLSVGVGGAAAAILIAPTLAALGAFASLVSDVKIVVERVEKATSVTRAEEPPEVPPAW